MLAPGVFRGIESNSERIFWIGPLPPLPRMGEIFTLWSLQSICQNEFCSTHFFMQQLEQSICQKNVVVLIRNYIFSFIFSLNSWMKIFWPNPPSPFFWAKLSFDKCFVTIITWKCLYPRSRGRGGWSNSKNSFRIGFYTPKNPWSQHSITISLIGESGTPPPSSKIESDLCPLGLLLFW